MTTKEINKALRHSKRVTLDDPWKWICRDLFGELVVIDMLHDDVPVRLATLSDKRKARIRN